LNPRTWVPDASMLTTRPLKSLSDANVSTTNLTMICMTSNMTRKNSQLHPIKGSKSMVKTIQTGGPKITTKRTFLRVVTLLPHVFAFTSGWKKTTKFTNIRLHQFTGDNIGDDKMSLLFGHNTSEQLAPPECMWNQNDPHRHLNPNFYVCTGESRV